IEGDLAERAWEAIHAIARALAEAPADTNTSARWPAERGASLAGGQAGLALFHGYLSRAASDEAQAELSEERLGGVLAAEETEEPSDEEGDEDFNEEIDEAVLGLLNRSPWRDQYDLISGL